MLFEDNFLQKIIIRYIKALANERNISTQHFSTIVARNMLETFGHRVAICYSVLDGVGSILEIAIFGCCCCLWMMLYLCGYVHAFFHATLHSRPQRLRSFWSAPGRIETSGRSQFLSMHRVLVLCFSANQICQSDNENVNGGLPVLEKA